jgi:Beta-galactosidase
MELLRTGNTRGSRRHLTGVTLLLGLAALVAAQPSSISERVSQPPIGARPDRGPTGPRHGSPPSGLFVCRGPSPTPDREVNFPFIDGWLVRPGWDAVEPAEGRYDWSYIEGEIATAKRLGKRLTLAILGGPQTPEWVYRAGPKGLHYTITSYSRPRREGKIPPLWDEVYLQKWTAFVRALGKRFSREDTIVLLHVTGATENGLEMQLPSSRDARERWRELGYTPQKVIAAWRRILDAFGEAFPDTTLDVDVHPVLGTDRIAEDVAAYGYRKFGKRFGVYGGWLSGRPADQDRHHAGMHTIAMKYGRLSFVGFQMIGNETRQPERFAPGGLRAAVEQAMGWGARYFELWDVDVMNPGMHEVLRETWIRLK